MPHWRHRIHPTDKRQVRRFRRDVKQHLGIDYRPENSPYDPLFRWLQKAKPTAGSPAEYDPAQEATTRGE